MIHDTAQHVTEAGLANSAARLLPAGTVCLSRTASVGYVVQMGRNMATSQDFVTWTCVNGLEPRYLVYALLAEGDDIRRFGKGSTHTTIYFPEVKAFHICLPPINEQRRIVAKLDSLFARTCRAREELARIPRLIEHYKQAILAAAFRGELTRTLREEEELPNWQERPLHSLITDGPTNGYSPRAGENPAGTMSLKLTATTRGALDLSAKAVKRLSETVPENSKFWLEDGDLLVQRANSLEYVGAAPIYRGPNKAYIYPDLMMRLRVESDILRSFLWRYLNGPGARAYFQANATGTAGNMPKINGRTLKALLVPVPSEREMAAIVSKIDDEFAFIDRFSAQSGKAESLLDHLDQANLAKAFRGELVPQDPNDEPAAVLLERIRAARTAEPKPKRKRRQKEPESAV
jgi:type I restriction enzyme S subunit